MSSTEAVVLAEHIPHDLEPRSQSPSNSFFLRGNSLLPPGPGTQEDEDVQQQGRGDFPVSQPLCWGMLPDAFAL